MATRKQTPAPVSKTVQRLLAQIHAEAEAATREALSARDGIVFLQPVQRATSTVRSYARGGLTVEDANGYSLTMWPAGDRPGSKWYAFEERVDSLGNKWSRSLGYFITDDFGTLVPVGDGE